MEERRSQDIYVKEIAMEAATEALNKFMLIIGINTDNKDNVLELGKDLTHLRETRLGREDLVKKSKIALWGVFITTVGAVLINSLIHYIGTLLGHK